MYFLKSLSTVVASALLVTSTVAAPVAPADKTVRVGFDKRDTPARSILCQAAIENLGRKLAARGPVNMREIGRGKGTDELDTVGLADCIGIAITVDRPEGDDSTDRWLMHFADGDSTDDLKKEVEEAKSKGATNIKAAIVHPKPETQIPSERESLTKDIDNIKKLVNDLVGSEVQPTTHDLTDSYQLKINGDKTIEPPTSQGEYMNEAQKAIYDRQMAGEEVSEEDWEAAYGEDAEDDEYDPEEDDPDEMDIDDDEEEDDEEEDDDDEDIPDVEVPDVEIPDLPIPKQV